MPTSKELARINIDKQVTARGWSVPVRRSGKLKKRHARKKGSASVSMKKKEKKKQKQA